MGDVYYKLDKKSREELISTERVRGTVTDTSCDDVRATFEDEHPRNRVDASDAYALTVFPFGQDDGGESERMNG